jgi:hypothetical protein
METAINNAALSAATSIAFPIAFLGFVAVSVLLFLTLLVSWLVLRAFYVPYSLPGGAADHERLLVLKVELSVLQAINAFVAQALEVGTSFSDVANNIRNNLGLIVVFAALVGVAIVYNEIHPALWSAGFEIQQCYVRPFVDGLVLRLLNVGRVLYSFGIGFVNAWAEIGFALTWGNFRVIVACTSWSILADIFSGVAGALFELLGAFVSWLATGLFFGGRMETVEAWANLGIGINTSRPILDCACRDLKTLWDLLYAIPMLSNLHTALDCTINIPTRVVQIPINVIIQFKLPSIQDLSEEAQCAVLATGDTAEDLVQLVVEFFYGLYQLIANYILSLPAAARVSLSSHDSATAAGQMSIEQEIEGINIFTGKPNTMTQSILRDTIIVLAAFTASGMTGVSSASVTGVDDFAMIAAAFHGLSLGWRQAMGDTYPQEMRASSADDTGLPPRRQQPFTFFSFLQGLNLVILFGLDALLRLVGAPWSRIFTEPVAFAIGALNQTIELVFHPVEAFSDPSGIKYIQFGQLFDHLRVWVDSWAQLLVVIDRILPCPVSKLAQFVVGSVEGVLEFVVAFIYAWIFPRWTVGEPPPVNCSVVSCTHPPDEGWTIFDIFPAYYSWEGSRLRRNLHTLLEGGECMAVVFGCNTTADNNNSTNATTDCADAPAGCAIRALDKILVEFVNFTLAGILMLPDIVRFNATKKTFADLPLEGLEAALTEFGDCGSNYLDTLDMNDEYCLTTEPPEVPPGPNDNQTLPVDQSPGDGITQPPPRDQWECRVDGKAYYLDERNVLVNQHRVNETDISTSAIYELQLGCDIYASRRCAIAASPYVQILGSAPDSNTTILLNPNRGNWTSLSLIFTMMGEQSELSVDPVTIPDGSNITNITVTDCTHSLPLPDATPPEWACLDGKATFLDIFHTNMTVRRFGLVNESGATTGQMNCSYRPHPLVTCVSSLAYYGGIQLFVRDIALYPAIDLPIGCTNGDPVDLHFIMCVDNTLLAPVFIPPVTVPGNISFILPVFYYNPGTVERIPVGCELDRIPGYYCDAMDEEPRLESGDTFAGTFDTGPDSLLTCINNTISPAPPLCTHVLVNYTNGTYAEIEVEGAEVRAWINGTRTAIPCEYGSSSLEFNISAVNGSLQGETLVDGITYLAPFFEAARRKVRAESVRSSTTQPAISAAFSAYIQNIVPRDVSLAAISAAHHPLYLDAIIRAANVTMYRKESLLCCFSGALRSTSRFIISFVFEILYTVRALLALPVFPSRPFPIPTFNESRVQLRDALCKLACAITRVIPVTFECDGLKSATGCGSGASCAHNMLCELIDIPLLLVDIPIDILTTIRALVQGNPPDASTNVLGSSCSAQDPGACFISIISYVILKVLFTITLAARGISAFFDCILCALIRLAEPSYGCIPILFAIIDPLADLIDGIGAALLTTALKIIVGIVEMIIYFFSGQWLLLVDTFFNKIVLGILDLGKSLVTLIFDFLLRIPGIKEIVNFFLNIAKGACEALNFLIHTLGHGPDLGCDTIPTVKRSMSYTGWLTANMSGTDVMDAFANASMPAYTACYNSMQTLNATDFFSLSSDQQWSAQYCLMAHMWVGDAAVVANGSFPSDCDYMMPQLYATGHTWDSLSILEKPTVIKCLDSRVAAEQSRVGGADWFPHDMYYNFPRRPVQVMDDMWFASDVWSQYQKDHDVPPATLVSSSYRNAWSQRGYDVSHLVALSAQASSAGMTASDVFTQVQSDAGGFAITDYVHRAVSSPMATSSWRLYREAYNKDRVTAMIQQIIVPLFSSSSNSTNDTLVSYVAKASMDMLEKRVDQPTLNVAYTASLPMRMWAANDSRLLQHTMGDLVDAIVLDVPALIVRVSRWANSNQKNSDNMKRAWTASTNAPYSLWLAGTGLLVFMKDWLGGKLQATDAWVRDPTVTSWLQANAESVHPFTFVGAASINVTKSNIITATMNSIVNAVAYYLPTGESLRGISAFMAQTTSESSPSSSVSSAAMRRASLSRFMAHVALAAAPQNAITITYANRTYSSLANGMMVHKADVTCQLAIFNSTTNTTTYPLCEPCLALDNLLGRIVRAVVKLVFHLGVPSSTYCQDHPLEPVCVTANETAYTSLPQTFQRFNDFETYLVAGRIPSRIGDSDANSARWPDRDKGIWGSILALIGDDTPNKLRFRDIAALAAASWNYIVARFNAGTGINSGSEDGGVSHGLGAIFLAQANEPANIAGAGISATAQMAQFYIQFIPDHLPTVNTSYAYNMSMSAQNEGARYQTSSEPTIPTTFDSFYDLGFAWIQFIFYSAISCDYNNELNGANKRFSLGEVIGIVLLFAALMALIFKTFATDSFLMAFGGSGMIFSMIVLGGTWWLMYDWSYLCLPASPVGFGDDAVAFLANTVFPSSPLAAGMVDQENYNNTNGVPCSGWQGINPDHWTVPSFTRSLANGGRFGFQDIIYNIVFWLQMLIPSALDWLRNTGANIIFLGNLIRLPFIYSRLVAYQGLSDTSMTKTAWSQFWWGSAVTLLSNIIIAAAWLLGLALLWPFIKAITVLFFGLIPVAAQMFAFSGHALYYMGLVPPPARKPKEEEEIPKDESEMTTLLKKKEKGEPGTYAIMNGNGDTLVMLDPVQ